MRKFGPKDFHSEFFDKLHVFQKALYNVLHDNQYFNISERPKKDNTLTLQ